MPNAEQMRNAEFACRAALLIVLSACGSGVEPTPAPSALRQPEFGYLDASLGPDASDLCADC
jgi:hypothetical protein